MAVLDDVVAAPVQVSGNVRPVALYTAACVLDELGRPGQAAARRARRTRST